MSEVRANALLRRWLGGQGAAMPSRDALMRIRQEVMMSREDAQPRLQLGQCEIRRYRQQLYWLPRQSSLQDFNIHWQDLQQMLPLPQSSGYLEACHGQPVLRLPHADEQVTVRFYAQGHVHIVGRSGGREMKKLWQELNIPPWQRGRIPLIYYNQSLICAPGVFVTQEGAALDGSGWQAIWHKNIKAGEQ
jgi:tRNA(Ile)-lysidine synthase